MKKPKTLKEAIELLMWLKDQLLGIRLDRKQLQQRYNWSEKTVERKIADGTIPRPLPFGGRPMWTLLSLAEAELAGQLPRPTFDEFSPISEPKNVPAGQASA